VTSRLEIESKHWFLDEKAFIRAINSWWHYTLDDTIILEWWLFKYFCWRESCNWTAELIDEREILNIYVGNNYLILKNNEKKKWYAYVHKIKP
jgi:uncharacterized protein YifE (UPF0438 family)